MKLSPMEWTDYTFKPMTTINAQIEKPHAGIKYSGAKWFQNHFKIPEISPLTVRVANVLGQVYEGMVKLGCICP